MIDPLYILIFLALACVVAVLATGIGGFARGGEFNRKHGNRMMRWRIIAQAVALVLMMSYLAIRAL